MDKKSKKSNFLRNLLATASVASVIVGGSSAAFGVNSVSVNGAAASEINNAGHWLQQDGVAGIVPPVGRNNFIFFGQNQQIHFNAALGGNLGTLDAYGFNQTAIVTADTQLLSVVNNIDAATKALVQAAVPGLAIGAGGAGARINFEINGAGTVMEFGENGTDGVLTGLGNVTLNNATAEMIISSRAGQHITGTIAASGAAGKGIITVNTTGLVFDNTIGAGNKIALLQLNNDKSATLSQHASFTHIQLGAGSELTVGGGANLTGTEIKGAAANTGTLIFAGASNVVAQIGNTAALKEIRIGNGIVDFQTVAGAANIKAQEISLTHRNSVMKLSTRAQDVEGDITTTTNNQGTLHFLGNKAHTVTGNVGSSGYALAMINFEGGGADVRQITGEVFTLNITSDGGTITFGNNVLTNETNLKDAATTINIKANMTASLGRVKFNGFNSEINVNAGGTVKGDFDGGGAVTGEIHFLGAGTFDGTSTKLNLVDAAAGVVNFLGKKNEIAEIHGVAGTTFRFGQDFELVGKINGVAGGAASNLEFTGDVKITGTIGENIAVGNISIAKDKTLTVDSDTIQAASIFDKAGQGTLTLIHKPANVTITSQISPLGGGTIDATGMGASKDLIIAGGIGTDPANAGNALEKMLLKGQNLILRPGAAAVVNIAEIHFDKKAASTVKFETLGAGYALGNLTNAENVTFDIDHNVTLYNTKTKDKLKETKLSAGSTLTLGKDNDITATSITTDVNNTGTLVFAGDSALRGPIGTANKKLKAITVRDNVTATTSGPAFVHEDVTLVGEKSVLVIDSNYTVGKLVGGADGVGTLRFVNKYPVELITTFAHPAPVVPPVARVHVNAIETLELTDGDVKLSAPDGLGGFKKIIFTSVTPATAPTATAPTLFLDREFKGINVDSNFDTTTGDMPTIQLIAGDNIVDKANHVGKDKDHLVNIKLGEKLDVNTKDFFAAVTTTDDGKGKVDFKDEADKVYGLGSEKFKLDTVRLFTDVENFGDTYAKEVVVFADKTYTAGGTISGGVLRLGDNAFSIAMGEIAKKHNNDATLMAPEVTKLLNSKISKDEGGATAVFSDGVTLLDDVISVGADNNLNFAGNAVIKGKIGVSGNAFSGMVTFTGDKDRTATLYSDMYVKDVDFGAETLKVAADKLTIGGVSHVNGTIALDSNQLTLKNTGTWGTNTNISTTLTRSGKLGQIVLNGAITVAGNVPVTVKITDYASLKDHRSQEYVFIDGYNHLAMADGSVNIDKIIGDVETNQAYSEWKLRVKGSDLIFTRICDEVKGVKKDLDGIGDDIDQQNAKMLAGIQGGDAAKYLDDINLIDEAHGGKAKRAESMQRLMNTESAQVTETIGNTVGHVSNIVNNRLFNITGQSGIVAAGSDDGSTSMGAWVMPYYSQAVQKNKGGAVGYAVKSGGGVFGFDTLANENLTIGAAVSIIQSNMKFKGYKAGEKTAINTLMLSIYGSQQLTKEFFVQAVASFGSSKVKNTDPRIVSVNTNASGLQTAKASYNSMSYGGELLFGYNAKVDDSVLVTPMAGIRYTRFNGEGYKETGTSCQNKDIRQKASNRVEAIIGARVATTVDTSGITVTPEVHAFVSQKLSGKSGKVDARLDGMTSPFTTRPDKGAKTSCNVGVGVSAKAGVMEYGVGYDAHLANKYVGHQGTLKVRVNF